MTSVAIDTGSDDVPPCCARALLVSRPGANGGPVMRRLRSLPARRYVDARRSGDRRQARRSRGIRLCIGAAKLALTTLSRYLSFDKSRSIARWERNMKVLGFNHLSVGRRTSTSPRGLSVGARHGVDPNLQFRIQDPVSALRRVAAASVRTGGRRSEVSALRDRRG